jgi:hypothetical protein
MTRRLDISTAARGLEHAELCLKLGDVLTKRIECLADLRFVEAAVGPPQLLHARESRQAA